MASEKKINNLGNFADLSAVWSLHPEGGREGDYLKIGNTEFVWNIFTRQWEPSGSTSGGGATQGAAIDGDLDVGGDLRVGGNATVIGTMTVGELNIGDEETAQRFKGQSSYKSIVFTRSDQRPSTPTGGGYGSPLPDGRVWSDGVPQGDKPIWMSSRIFTSDGNAPQEDGWKVPVLMSDAENFDVEFSMLSTGEVPSPPPEQESQRAAAGWFDPVRNAGSGLDWTKMHWMATRTSSLAQNGTVVWSAWTIVLIKGETGDGVQNVFTVTTGSTPSISGSSYPPSGWYKSVDSLTVSSGDVLWMSERRLENGAWSNWSTPVRLNGIDGEAGKDGTDIEFIYKRSNSLPTVSDVPSNDRSTDDYVPSSEDTTSSDFGWSDNPSGVSTLFKYEWMCQRTKGANDSQWSQWSGPFVWSAYGDRGMDGDGVEYAFIRTKINTKPTIVNDDEREDSHSTPLLPTDNGYLPGATWSGSTASDLESNGASSGHYEFTDEPKGVEPTWPYEWVTTRKKVGGVWQAFSDAALWACYSVEHTVSINADGYWVIDGVTTTTRATGVVIKGRVDVYQDSDKTSNDQTSLESYPSSLTGDDALNVGDCWIVENGTGVAGHLFLCVSTTATTVSTMWQDLGEFKGDPGQSQYMHLAWAQKITFTGNPQTYSGNVGFTKDPAVGQSYDWLGIKVNATESDSALQASDYKWNYLKGKDGMDVEYVYIRTNVKTPAPTINEATDSQGFQDAEHLPTVANYMSYLNGELEHNGEANDPFRFTDDPQGVTPTWPYEWMSKREKVGGEWQTFMSPAKLIHNYSEDGESQPWVKVDPVLIAIDADNSGVVSSAVTKYVKCWLYYGKEKQSVASTYNRCSRTYNGATTYGQSVENDGSVKFSITVGGNSTPQVNRDITISMTNGNVTASVTVPVIINRAGAAGRSVFRSTVFKRSATKPDNPGNDAGSYSSPVPDGWSDGIGSGDLPIWMTSRVFASDGATPPQQGSWDDVALVKDIADTFDVEFSPQALGSTPTAPIDGVNMHEGSGTQLWYDPEADSSYSGWDEMNWMAVRTRVIGSSGSPVWSDWTITQIRGEKGDDGAGQAWIQTSIDEIVVDCDSDGKPFDLFSKTFNAKLRWGDEECALTTGNCSVTENNEGGLAVIYNSEGTSQIRKTAQITYTIGQQGVGGAAPTIPAISSGYITIVLEGKDSSNVTHIATRTISVIANKQGATGATGPTGPALRFRGDWNTSARYTYDGTFRDCVRHGGEYWMLNTAKNGETVVEPANVSGNPWTSMGNQGFVATELLLAENGAIELLAGNVINLFANINNAKVKTASMNADQKGSYCIYYGESPFGKRMEFCYDGWIYYYNNDEENTIAWKLGHGGQIIQNTVESWDIIRLHYFGSSITNVPTPSSSATWQAPTIYYQYSNSAGGDNNGKVYKQNKSSLADNGYYTPDAGVRNMNNGDDEPEYVFMLYKIEGGKIVQRYEVSSNGLQS